MSLFVDPPFSLGQTLGVTNATDGANWVGAVKNFPDVDPATGRIRSNRVKTCVAVRNASGIILAPKRLVAFDVTNTQVPLAGFTQVRGYVAATNEERVGVVDEHLPATGVAVNDVFWVTVEGPTEVAVALSGSDIVIGDRLAAITAAASTGTTAGRVTKSGVGAATTGAGDNGLGVLGRACSTGATTGANVLAIVKTRY